MLGRVHATLLVDAATHPRFAVGESTIPYTLSQSGTGQIMGNDYQQGVIANILAMPLKLLAPLLSGMEAPPHERRLGPDETSYFLGLPATGSPDNRTPGYAGGQK